MESEYCGKVEMFMGRGGCSSVWSVCEVLVSPVCCRPLCCRTSARPCAGRCGATRRGAARPGGAWAGSGAGCSTDLGWEDRSPCWHLPAPPRPPWGMASSAVLVGLLAALPLPQQHPAQRPMARPGARKKLDVAACSQRLKSQSHRLPAPSRQTLAQQHMQSLRLDTPINL